MPYNSKDDKDSSAKLKKRKRDLERLINKKDLPSNIRIEKQKVLAGVELQLQNASNTLKSQKFAKKYHMVKFFEKKKALKNYKRVEKEYSQTEDKKDKKKLKKKLSHSAIDLLYVVNFPKDEKYVALFPKETEESAVANKGQIKTDNLRIEYRKKIQQQLDANTLPIGLDEILAGNIDHRKLHKTMEMVEPDKIKSTKKVEEEDEFFE